jgi:hypothetical protein
MPDGLDIANLGIALIRSKLDHRKKKIESKEQLASEIDNLKQAYDNGNQSQIRESVTNLSNYKEQNLNLLDAPENNITESETNEFQASLKKVTDFLTKLFK